MTKTNLVLLHAYDLGYRCDDLGNVTSKKGQLIPYTDSRGYLSFSVRIYPPIHHKKISRHLPVHRLQAYQKYGDKIFEKGIHVRHLNGNPLDNRVENILIGSASENMMDKPKEVRSWCAINASNSIRKFSNLEMIEIKKFHNEFKSYEKTMKKFNIGSKGTLHRILNVEYVTEKL